MVEEACRRCSGRGRFFVANLGEPLTVGRGSIDGVTCSLVLHNLRAWSVPLRSFADALHPGGWMVLSLGTTIGEFADAGFVAELAPVHGVPWFIVYKLRLASKGWWS